MNANQYAVCLIVLACSLTLVSAQRGTFEFHDHQGKCWRCSPGAPCLPCPNSQPNAGPIPWPDQCVVPNCRDLIVGGNHLSTIFPSTDSRVFYQCAPDPQIAGNWIAITIACPCDTLFSYQNQRCDWPWEWIPHCTNLQIPVVPEPCPGPDDITTEATTPTTTELTTETTAATTAPPCVCVPWWPCWCNPCFRMPCQSCNGCPGMMG